MDFANAPDYNLWPLQDRPVSLVGNWSESKRRLLDGEGRARVFLAQSIDHGEDPYGENYQPENHADSDEYWAEKAQNYAPYRPSAVAKTTNGQDPGNDGLWGPVIQWPHIPVSAANLPDGRILTWASNQRTGFPGGQPEFTYTAVWTPWTGQFVEINHSGHDMFCGHNVLLEDGRVFVNGGRNTVEMTTIFDPVTNTWNASDDMNHRRWYPTTLWLPGNEVFTAIGSSGSGIGQRRPELWREGQGWQELSGIDMQGPVLDYGHFERHWWPFFYVGSDGLIFHAGPTPKMHKIDVNATGIGGNPGSLTQVGENLFSGSWYPKHGITVLYDEDKILVAGGATSGSNGASTNLAATIDISGPAPVVTNLPASGQMNFARRFANGIMLPTGEVLVIGGNTSGIKFSDQGTILAAEIWNPDTETWREVADMAVPRNYHSVALLLNDGRVMSGGGGLCGACSPNHQDAQVYSPPYLFNADGSPASRPSITSAPSTVDNGQTYSVSVTGSPIASFSMIKMGSTTHGVNSDQRFVRVPFTQISAGQYAIDTHANPNVLLGGYYQLFAVDDQGVPSEAAIVRVVPGSGPNNIPPSITNPGAQDSFVNTQISFAIVANDPNNDDLVFSANGLPPGLNIDTDTGEISGVPTTAGTFTVTVTADDTRGGIDSEQFDWTIHTPTVIPNLSDNWNFSGNADSTGSNNGQFFNGATTVFDTERNQQVLSCDGTNDHVQISNNVAASFTFTTWVRTSATSPTGTQAWNGDGLIWSDVAGTANDFIISVLNDRIAFHGGDTEQTIVGATAINDNEWHHVAVTVQSGGQVVIYVDGIVDATGSAGTATLNANPNINFCGNLVDGLHYDGLMDDVRHYDRSLTALEVLQLASLGVQALVVEQITSPPQLVNTSVNYSAVASGSGTLEYRWLFDDGTPEITQSSPSVSHTFTQAGRYNVRLTVASSTGENQVINFWQAVHEPLTAGAPTQSSTIVYEAGADRIWNVNPDNESVSVFNAVTNAKVSEITVGLDPRNLAIAPDGRVWVTNKRSDSISIINSGSLTVAQTISLDAGAAPFGIAFSGGNAFVVLEGQGSLLKMNATTGAIIDSLNVGENARHVSATADGQTLLVSRFITPPVPGEDTANPQMALGGGEVLSINPAGMSLNSTVIIQHSLESDSEAVARGIPNYLGPVAISPDGLSGWVPSKQDNIERGSYRDGQNLNHDMTVRAITSKIDMVSGLENYMGRIDHDDAGVPKMAAFGPYGAYLFVALEASRDVIVVDPYVSLEITRFQVGRAPQGLTVSDDGDTLYVHNFMDRSITAYDISTLIQTGEPVITETAVMDTVAIESLSSTVLLGKQLFYDARDPRLARQQYMSCASCHNDAEQDGRVWDLAGFGEGLRNTISLRGRSGMGHGMLHWSANFDEVQDFEGQIRDLAGGTGLMTNAQFNTGTRSDPLGDPKAGVSVDLDALAQYLSSLSGFDVSPYRTSSGNLTAAGEAGRGVFESQGCADCHGGDSFSDDQLHDIGTITAASGSRLGGNLPGIDTPTLRGVWATAPYLHDGSASTLTQAIQAHSGVNVTGTDLNNLVAFVQQIDTSEPGIFPAGQWQDEAIGDQGVSGSFVDGGSTMTIDASGANLWDDHDDFYFVYQPLNGDGEIIARVSDITGTHINANAGVMIRETLDDGSRYAMVSARASNRVDYLRRRNTDGNSQASSGSITGTPAWVRLERVR